MAEIGATERGEAPQPTAVGNAYSVTVSPTGVAVRNAVLDDALSEHYDFNEMRQALGVWIAAIERAHRNPA